jgi:hypothetical protein
MILVDDERCSSKLPRRASNLETVGRKFRPEQPRRNQETGQKFEC